jgi:hypothetical protein
VAFPVPTVTKPHYCSTALYMDLSYRISPKSVMKQGRYRQARARARAHTHTHTLTPLSTTVTEPTFTKFTLEGQLFVKNPTKFHENPTTGLFADVRSQTDRSYIQPGVIL